MSIKKVGISNIHNVGAKRSPDQSSVNQFYKFQESFRFSEKELESQVNEYTDETINLASILLLLMKDVLSNGCAIFSRKALVRNDYIIEASFQPPTSSSQIPIIYLPMKESSFKLEIGRYMSSKLSQNTLDHLRFALDDIVKSSSNKSLVKLLILLAHEYGHFKSYQRGYHNKELKLGLSLMHTMISKNADKYTYQVFSEEVTAWRFARDVLKFFGFKYWGILESVKYNSLQAYYELLRLRDASIDTYCRISMLDIDLKKLFG